MPARCQPKSRLSLFFLISEAALTPTIRTATPDEAEIIRNLMRTLIEDTLEPAHSASKIANVNANLDIWLQRPADCVHLVAVIEDQIVGVLLVKDFWNLCSLFVTKPCQGMGIGKALVETAAGLCRPRSPKAALYLNAAPSAVPFYARVGFTARESLQVLPAGFQAMWRPL